MIHLKIKGKFGAITVCKPDKPPTAADEKRLYNVLIDCLLVRTEKDRVVEMKKCLRTGRIKGRKENIGL